MPSAFPARFRRLALGLTIATGLWSIAQADQPRTEVTAFDQAIAEAAYAGAAFDDVIGAFYRDRAYRPIWVGGDAAARARRAALLRALRGAGLHGLPAGRYDPEALRAQLASVRTTRDLGLAEVAMSRAFLQYATDVHSGILDPSSIDDYIDRQPARPDGLALLRDISTGDPKDVLAGLAPQSLEYRRLLKERLNLQRIIQAGGWGATVPMRKMEPGDTGPAVIALRDRLVRMGYLRRGLSARYDKALERAVRAFQQDHGLEPDGVAGKGTIAEINLSATERMKSVLVALERERWLGERGRKYVLVNQPDFTARIIDDGRETFRTRTVIGKNVHDRRSPEFSDEMEHMIINPSWHVPRSIIVKEYLPKLQQNPNAAGHLIITDVRGQQVDRGSMDFTRFTARNFPFDMRQPPGARNALGRVKFMFPNKHNVYLHDTPEKHLFKREVRAYSHGCIRLADPFDFAYALLAEEVGRIDDPVGFFQSTLKTGRETQVDLDRHLPVHIIYRTAFTKPRGGLEFRRDVYGRDAKIWEALQQQGVALPGVQG